MAAEPTHEGCPDDVAPLFVFESLDAAERARAALEVKGIRCSVQGDDGGGMLPNLAASTGVWLLVPVSQAAAAAALLDSPEPAMVVPPADEPKESLPNLPGAAPAKRLAPVQILLGVVLGVILSFGYQWASRLGDKIHYYYSDGRLVEETMFHDGHLVERLRDRNLDGKWDYWAYYEHGQLVRVECDNNFDGQPDETWTYVNGALVRMEKDTDFNGTPDEIVTYNKYGLPEQMDMRPNGAAFTTLREFYRHAVLTEVWRGGDSNGSFKEIVRYDPFSEPIATNAGRIQLLSPAVP